MIIKIYSKLLTLASLALKGDAKGIKYRIIQSFVKPKKAEELKSEIARCKGKVKLIIGAGNIYQAGWLSTDKDLLDVLDINSWKAFFEESSIDNIFAEHVWEHLTYEDGKDAIKLYLKFLKDGGKLRLAVPDGFHSNKDYIEQIKPGGSGAGADDHKVLYTYKDFLQLTKHLGCTVHFLEYFDENNKFHQRTLCMENGYVRRSFNNDQRNIDGVNNYSSLIVDIVKVNNCV